MSTTSAGFQSISLLNVNYLYIQGVPFNNNQPSLQAEIDAINAQLVGIEAVTNKIDTTGLTLPPQCIITNATTNQALKTLIDNINVNIDALNKFDVSAMPAAPPATIVITPTTTNQALKILIDANATNITTLQGDVTTIQGQITTLQGDVTTIQGQITTINGQITTINGQITAINTKLAHFSTFSYGADVMSGIADGTGFACAVTGGSQSGNGIFVYPNASSQNEQIQLVTALDKNLLLRGGNQVGIFGGTDSSLVNRNLIDIGDKMDKINIGRNHNIGEYPEVNIGVDSGTGGSASTTNVQGDIYYSAFGSVLAVAPQTPLLYGSSTPGVKFGNTNNYTLKPVLAGLDVTAVGVVPITLTAVSGLITISALAGGVAITTGVGACAITTGAGGCAVSTGAGTLSLNTGAGVMNIASGSGNISTSTISGNITMGAGKAVGGTAGNVELNAAGNVVIQPDTETDIYKTAFVEFNENAGQPSVVANRLYQHANALYFDGALIGGGGVDQIVAGSGITIAPPGGTGVVTITSTAVAGVSQITAGSGITISPLGGTGNVTISAQGTFLPLAGGNMVGDIYMKNSPSGESGQIYQGDGAEQVKLYRPMSSYQAPFPSIGPPTYTGELLSFYNGDNNAPTQTNFTGWFPQSLVSTQPDFMTQLITVAGSTVYSLANTSTPSSYDDASCMSFPTFTNGVHITGGTVYIFQSEPTQSFRLTFGYPDGTPIYSKTFAPGSFPATGLFTFTLDYTHKLSTGQYTAYWDNSAAIFSLMVANPAIKTHWCGTLTSSATSYYLMAFTSGLTSTIYKWFPAQTTVEEIFVLDGVLYGIQEQMIGSGYLYFYGLFDNITLNSTTARVNNIFTYNVGSGIVQALRADTALQQNPPIGTNGAVYGVEQDTASDRTWFWGDFTYVGTDYLGNPTPPRNDILLKCGCDFTTTADWQLPVMFEGINGYSQCRGGKLLNYAGASYSLMVWATEISDGNIPPVFSPFNAVGMNYPATGPPAIWTVSLVNAMLGGSISQPVANIQRITNAGGGSGNHRLFFTGNFNNGIDYPTSAVCLSIMYADGDSTVNITNGQYQAGLNAAYNSSDTTFWIDNGVQISVSNLRKMTNDVLVMNTNGYGLTSGGGILALVSVDQTGALPTKYNITGMPRYSTKFIGGNDATKILLTCSLNENNFFFSQTFDATAVPVPTDAVVIAINGAKFLVDNTAMDKIVFAGSNQDYSSVSFIAGKVEDKDYNWYWLSQVGALNYYQGATLFPNICACPDNPPSLGTVLSVGNSALNPTTNLPQNATDFNLLGCIEISTGKVYAGGNNIDLMVGDGLAPIKIQGAITKGSMLVGNSTETKELVVGVDGLFLKTNSTLPEGVEWASSGGTATTTSTLNVSAGGITNLKQSLIFPTTTTITDSNITAQIDGTTKFIQEYTFGKSIPNRYVMGCEVSPLGSTLAYSNDGFTWIPLGATIFATQGYGIGWNGTMWIAGGSKNPIGNSLAYSYDGITWIGLGATVFNNYAYNVVWGRGSDNVDKWVATGTGAGGSTLGYSLDGINWVGLGNSIFSSFGSNLNWNGYMWLAFGQAVNTIAYSYNGINWVGLGTSIFSSLGHAAAWNGLLWAAGGDGTNSLAYSYDGITWVGLGTGLFTAVYNITWNGKIFVAAGYGANHIAYSSNGINWTGLGAFFSPNYANRACWDGARWFMAGSGNSSTLQTSIDGITWNNLGVVASSNINGIKFNDVRPNVITFPINRTVAVGSGTNTIAYSSTGLTWTGIGTAIFSTQGRGVAWNGKRWVAVGQGTNTIAYSTDGIIWTGIGTAIFSTNGNGVVWNDTRWVAVGQGTNTIAYSADGITWAGVGTAIFSTSGNGVAWNGTRFVAVGQGTNSIAYSTDGIIWTGIGTAIFSTSGNGVAWNGTYFVAVGQGTNTIAYSADGITWTGVGTAIFSTSGNGVAWNETKFVAVGQGTNSIAYSADGITWTGVGTAIFSTSGNGVAWNGQLWVGLGQGTNTIATSPNGITWTGQGTTIFSAVGKGVAWNAGKGSVSTTSITLNKNGTGLTDRLDVVSGSYYNTGFTNFTLTIKS